MPVDVLGIRVQIHSPDEVFASCADFAGLSLDLLRPSSVSCNSGMQLTPPPPPNNGAPGGGAGGAEEYNSKGLMFQ